MSLEAIAATLGHRSPGMTLRYAKSASRTVADEYFAVTDKVDALYGQAPVLPADAIGPKMARLRREHHRMLGNGYCTRPAELDCAFESICETCTFFRPASSSAPPCKPSTTTPSPRPPRAAVHLAARPPRPGRLMNRPPLRLTRPGQLPAPATGDDSLHILTEATGNLARQRTPYWLGDSRASPASTSPPRNHPRLTTMRRSLSQSNIRAPQDPPAPRQRCLRPAATPDPHSPSTAGHPHPARRPPPRGRPTPITRPLNVSQPNSTPISRKSSRYSHNRCPISSSTAASALNRPLAHTRNGATRSSKHT